MNKELEEKVYEEYCKRHPEEIHSDFMLDEDGNEDYIAEIIEDLTKESEAPVIFYTDGVEREA